MMVISPVITKYEVGENLENYRHLTGDVPKLGGYFLLVFVLDILLFFIKVQVIWKLLRVE